MFESIVNFFKKLGKNENKETKSKETAKERLHLVLMQDRANVSADFLEMMKQEIIEVIKKYIEVDEKEIDVRLTNEVKEDGTTGAPSLYANIPIMNIKNEMKKEVEEKQKDDEKKQEAEKNNNANKSEKQNNGQENIVAEDKELEESKENKQENINTESEKEEVDSDIELEKEKIEEKNTDSKKKIKKEVKEKVKDEDTKNEEN